MAIMTADTERRTNRLAVLAGSNPLRNYVAAPALKRSEVVLLYSPETQEPRDHLRPAFTARRIRVSEVCTDDATEARKVRDACRSLQVDHPHYSGGTEALLAALTEIRSQTSEERSTGAPARTTLRATRVVVRGLQLVAPLSRLAPLDPRDCPCLALAARHGGLARERGRGHVRITIDGDPERNRTLAKVDGGCR
jgi:hypothetical protein